MIFDKYLFLVYVIVEEKDFKFCYYFGFVMWSLLINKGKILIINLIINKLVLFL